MMPSLKALLTDRLHRSGARGLLPALALTQGLALTPGRLLAAPYKPTDDRQVLVRLPVAATDPRGRALADLRRQRDREPGNAALAAQLAWAYIDRLLAEGDPRDAGYAQAAIGPWWTQPEPPTDLRVARAVLRQFRHDFDAALADLDAVVRQDPDDARAWAWIVAIAMVQARYDRARQACDNGLADGDELQAVACSATVDAATGQAATAVAALQQALDTQTDASPGLRLWVLTRLAETHDRLGHSAAAEGAFRAALALRIEDSYLLAAYADFLLDQGRPAEVLVLLKDRERNDLHLLRLALAAKALQHDKRAVWQGMLAARFDAARQRGDTAHQKEEARFALELLADAQRALPLAAANYALQREAADARVLLETALAARQKAAAAPVLAWLRSSRFESRVLAALASRVEALP
jgi:tetratricopeptide (TPR) repeat protein